MKTITGVCSGKRYKLSISKGRLTQLSQPDPALRRSRYFLFLRELGDSLGASTTKIYNRVSWASIWVALSPGDRTIGCTTFSKSAWRTLIAAAKRASR